MNLSPRFLISALFVLPVCSVSFLQGCTSDKQETRASAQSPVGSLNNEVARTNTEASQTALQLENAQVERDKEILALQSQIAEIQRRIDSETNEETLKRLQDEIAVLRKERMVADVRNAQVIADLKNKLLVLKASIEALEAKVADKLSASSLANTNIEMMRNSLDGHTSMYPLQGSYKTLVIPVEFAPQLDFDGKFKNEARYYNGQAQDDLFGENNAGSMHSFYLHASGGLLNVSGEVVNPVRVSKPLSYYGKAIAGSNDEHAKDLVVEALQILVAQKGANNSWWEQFDRWDLNDFDHDGVYSEPDGFIDAVILIYAGKEQSSCQSTFDPQGKKPGSDDVPSDDPRAKQARECYNRIWPHRSSIFLSSKDPNLPTTGPVIEGQVRDALGIKINKSLHAFDYNMQSEYSDVSTFSHEFGHSLTLPDLYALSAGDNNVGSWDLMGSNARNNPQELGSYHRMALGWMNPKIVNEGETTSAYLGLMNFVSDTQREKRSQFSGPDFISQVLNGFESKFSILSAVPSTGEAVYKSLMIRLKPSEKSFQETTFPPAMGSRAAYSGRFDNATRSLRFKVEVPENEDSTLSFDALWKVETETNVQSREPDIRVVTNFDIGVVKINGETKELLHLLSGDENGDSLAEANPDCDAKGTLELRTLIVSGKANKEDVAAFRAKLESCQKPVWVKKAYDLSQYRGHQVEVEIAYTTDPGFNETGIFVDNVALGRTVLFDFENGIVPGDEWVISQNGTRSVKTNQFYMLEYRDPQSDYKGSFNKDRNIGGAMGMAMFMPKAQGLSMRDRFRVVTLNHQPGVLAWYFDSAFDRRTNMPESEATKGQGYYLPVNGKLREVAIPGVFSNAAFKDAAGFYIPKNAAFEAEKNAQINEFKCFGYTQYATYLDGTTPNCAGMDEVDGMNLLHDEMGRKLHFANDSFNNFLPVEQRTHFGVRNPGWLVTKGTFARSAIQTFRPAESEPFEAITVWKSNENGVIVRDTDPTMQGAKFEPMDEFIDAQHGESADQLKDERFWGNGAIVAPRGLSFKVVSPRPSIAQDYAGDCAHPDANEYCMRAPKVKVLINWSR